MSRTQKAATTAVFAYLRFGLAIVTGIFLVPLTLRSLGARTWGLWLASSEVLTYAGMVELGILGVLPWMLAEADGRRDRDELSMLVSQGVWFAACVGLLYAGVAVVAWHMLAPKMFLSQADRDVVVRPLVWLVVTTAITYPLGVYRTLIVGIQDVVFNGVLSIAQGTLGALLTAVLLVRGYGLYALLWGTTVPLVLTLGVSAVRVAVIAPDLVLTVARPQIGYLRKLLSNGFGSWLGSLGWQVLAASNGIVITYMGHAEWVPVYACTAKLATMCMPLTWVLPDSGHVGLAQLYGEQTATTRVRHVVMMMQRLHLLIAGALACGLLVFNPAFVTRWVGPALFGGLSLNALLAVGVLVHSFIHGLVSSASIIGNRQKVGALVLVNGLLQTVLAIVLGHRFGLAGIAWASLAATTVTALPGAVMLLRASTALTARQLLTELVAPWATRALPFGAAAALLGAFSGLLGVWVSAVVAGLMCVAYAWQMRPLCTGLPIDARWTDWLVRWRILPGSLPVPATVSATSDEA